MAYDSPRYGGDATYSDDQGFGASGFDGGHEADYGQGYAAPEYEPPLEPPPPHPTRGARFAAFGDDRRDRISVHLLWEGVLVLFAAAAAYLLHDSAPSVLRDSDLEGLLLSATVVGLVSVGAGLSFRAATPNLAVGPLAYASAMFFADRSDGGLTTAALVTTAAAAGIGVVIAVIVVGFQVPAWAGSLGVGIAVIAWLQRQDEVTVVRGAYDPASHARYWFLAFVMLSVVSGLFGVVGSIRATIGGYRATGDPAQRMPASAVTAALLAIIASSVLASVAGVVLALSTRPMAPGDGGLGLTVLAVGAVLLGGTSAHGRRGGVFGTALAVTVVVLLSRLAEVREWDLSQLAVGAAAILVGLVTTRLVEAFGTAAEGDGALASADGWSSHSASAGSSSDGWPPDPADSGWSTQLSARTSDDGWGTTDRWDR
ncbi:MAG: ABC transporter permease [Micromonosporaceae bacterium]|nr:ABC transporter permease [Micromonosporaceae bacterium]